MSAASAGTSDRIRTDCARQHVGLIAPLNRRFLADLALHAIADLGFGQRRVLAEHVLGDQAQAVLVLEEAALIAAQIGAVRSAEHLERRELHDRRLEPRLIDDDGRRVGFENCAGQHDRKRFADADGAGAGPPPALERIGGDILRRGRHGGEQREQTNGAFHVEHVRSHEYQRTRIEPPSTPSTPRTSSISAFSAVPPRLNPRATPPSATAARR